ncbi:MAG TPA: DUF1015 domain-containing protein [Anaerolineales bacterium]|nr:DUF1015 domain-containing protein [Anaerolineales bacterium]
MKNFEDIGVQIPDIYLPDPGIDPRKWAVIACDQYTSEPEYWEQLNRIIGDAPSTLKLTLPEIYLGDGDEPERIKKIQAEMGDILSKKLIHAEEGFILVRRTVEGKTRTGLMLALDLEKYDYNKGSSSLIRATEGTIVDRLPPRMKIREGADLEFPHIMVLIDDPAKSVIEPLLTDLSRREKVYDFDLVFNSGHLTGYKVSENETEKIIAALRNLADPTIFETKYDVHGKPVLLFAMGDGNHSLATAKAIWEKIKAEVGMDHPARYALVEVENLHDAALEFEPIHRVLFGVKENFLDELATFFSGNVIFENVETAKQMVSMIDAQAGPGQKVGVILPGKFIVLTFTDPSSNLPVGTLQTFLDSIMRSGAAEKIDYVHGEEVTVKLGSQPGNIGFYLPGMDKSDLFKTVILDGALPRKTFSMGEAHEKRFYFESRKIVR